MVACGQTVGSGAGTLRDSACAHPINALPAIAEAKTKMRKLQYFGMEAPWRRRKW
jgi:hypothetical protein